MQPADIQEVLARVEPAVVSIETSGFELDADGTGPVHGAGSGMILTSDGEVLTNNHVVAGATSRHGDALRPGRSPGRPT